MDKISSIKNFLDLGLKIYVLPFDNEWIAYCPALKLSSVRMKNKDEEIPLSRFLNKIDTYIKMIWNNEEAIKNQFEIIHYNDIDKVELNKLNKDIMTFKRSLGKESQKYWG